MIHSRTVRRAFTLVEMIVSVGIFSVVMLVATGAFLVVIDNDRRSRATNDLATSLYFAIENMSRSIRTGSNYQCGGSGGTNCWPSGLSTLTITNDQGQTITYLLKSNHTIGECTSGTCSDGVATSITDPRIYISTLTFYVQGVGTSDNVQPRVTFVVQGSTTPEAGTQPISFSIETTDSQRLLDL